MVLFADTTYPSEITPTAAEADIILEIRNLIGDLPKLEYDSFVDTGFSNKVLRSGTTYKFSGEKAWPLKITASGVDFTTSSDPTVNNYQFLIFSGSPLLSADFEMFYQTFKFSDQEILNAYDESLTLLANRSIPTALLTQGLCVVQAAITLLDGFLNSSQGDFVRVRDGRTEYDSTFALIPITTKLGQLRKQLDDMLLQTRHHISLNMEGIRLE